MAKVGSQSLIDSATCISIVCQKWSIYREYQEWVLSIGPIWRNNAQRYEVARGEAEGFYHKPRVLFWFNFYYKSHKVKCMLWIQHLFLGWLYSRFHLLSGKKEGFLYQLMAKAEIYTFSLLTGFQGGPQYLKTCTQTVLIYWHGWTIKLLRAKGCVWKNELL